MPNLSYEQIKLLRTTLAFAQRNHHGQMLRFRDQISNTHKYANWQSCPSLSCKEVLPAWKFLKKLEDDSNPVYQRIKARRGY